jgi:hypothetical protein
MNFHLGRNLRADEILRMVVSFSSESLSSHVPSTLKLQNCNFGSFIASLLHVDSRLTVNVETLLKTEHSDPKESQVAGHQTILHSKELHNLFYQIAHLQQECHNSKSVIFEEKLLRVLKCYNFP